ncbi:MAG: hypothetical protein QOK31_666 [Solirubrobacteraceae bacterium]|jgi:outer membrane protein assembly factor BamB|nr:hypothetical protein [Solirubrobacteraceae bacterium]
MAPSSWPRAAKIGAAIAALLSAGGVAAYLVLRSKPANISHPNIPFRAQPPPRPRAAPDRFVWPIFGYDPARTQTLPASRHFHGPWRRRWTKRGVVLTEFSPIMAGPTIYWLKNDGNVFALDKRRGHERWHRRLGVLAAASPAWHRGSIYVVLLKRAKNVNAGRVAALDVRRGHIRWKRDLPARSESSPIVVHGLVIFGTEDGTVYAVHESNGRTAWTYHASGAVKGGLALSGGTLYFGDYNGKVYAIRARDGAQVWQTTTSGASGGLGSGNFYATPAVAFGRVYMGNTDSRVYSFSQATGKLAWATGTGHYVYGSAAVTNVPHLGPTVYVGSYDGNFYAFDARSGNIRWQHAAGGRISGSSTVVGSTVYFADLGDRDTIGLDVRTGHQVFRLADGAFTAVISDGRWLFVNGYASLYALSPRGSRH